MEKIAKQIAEMGTKHILHPQYDSKATPWHSPNYKASHVLADIRAKAIAAGRIT